MVLRMACRNVVCLRNRTSSNNCRFLVPDDTAASSDWFLVGTQILGLSDYPDSLLDFLKLDGDRQLPHPKTSSFYASAEKRWCLSFYIKLIIFYYKKASGRSKEQPLLASLKVSDFR